MSRFIEQLKKIENLNPMQLAAALEFNGYPECSNAIRAKGINGSSFLKLTEVNISLWRLPIVQSRRLWSFVQLVNQDPMQFLLKPELNKKPPVSAYKPHISNPPMKSLSFLHKSKLVEQVLNLETDDAPSTSTLQPVRNHPRQYPKPPNLIPLLNYKDECEINDSDDEDDNNDGYLSPVSNSNTLQDFTIPQNIPRNAPNRASFLNKYRKPNFENLENRRQSIDNKYEAQRPSVNQIRPILRSPLNNVLKYEDDDDNHDLPEYTDVTEEDDEPLAEYTSVLEDEESHQNTTVPHRPLPPVPHSVSASSSFRTRPRLPSSSDSDISSTSLTVDIKSKTLSNPNLSVQNSCIRKSPVNLPKPPNLLPLQIDASIIRSQLPPKPNSNFFLRPLPPPPSISPTLRNKEAYNAEQEDDEELTDYCEVDLEREPCYRETDRKGARMLLSGYDDGAFLIRPSRQQSYICTFSIMHHIKLFNLGVQKYDDGTIGFEGITTQNEQPQFYEVADIVSYYSENPLYVSGQTIFLKNVLPQNRR